MTEEKKYLLAACPFCGSTDISKGSRMAGHGDGVATVRCRNCGAEVPQDYGSYESVIDKWNRRVK